MIFRDLLYGEIILPEWLLPFLYLPELVRLRGVRLSNIDSIQYKDFGSATRYDHALGVVHLALRVAKLRQLSQSETVHLVLAALLHDVGTPPFAHTLEVIFDDVDHELEIWNALGIDSRGHNNGFNAYDGELPQFVTRCKSVSKLLGIVINPDEVGEIINGQSDLGFLIKGTLDLDNIDNVIRGTHYMGLPATGELALSIVDWISSLDKQPLLDGNLPKQVHRWLELRDEYYRLFFDSNDDEKGRQALLQFLIRESARLGFPKERMLKTTDEGLIYSITDFANRTGREAQYLSDAVRKFKCLEPITKVTDLQIDDINILNSFRVKNSINWFEKNLRKPGFIPMIFLAKRRFSESLMPKDSLFPYPKACLSIFALYEPKHGRSLATTKSHNIYKLQKELLLYAHQQPWRVITERTKQDLRESLDSWGNWSFIGSRNDSIHTYPSTFVYTIPNAFIKSLGLAGDVILDPFCGSGITGIEALKAGCHVVCADINEIALLVSRVKSTYLTVTQRESLRSIRYNSFNNYIQADFPKIDNLYKWHHPETIEQLATILGFINNINSLEESNFLRLCFSSILTSTTARRGKEHGWFADNTPLAKGELAPPFVDAFNLFINKIKRNLIILENIYSVFERRGDLPVDAFSKLSIFRANVSNSSPESYGLKPGSIGGIITSPPYLCMSDYSLGQRLSYAWLYPEYLKRDFDEEIGARRHRTNAQKAFQEYTDSLSKFAQFCEVGVREGGFVALVMGESESIKFKEKNILGFVDSLMLQHGFSLLWEKWRPISWHRNHGYERVKTEKLTVFVKK